MIPNRWVIFWDNKPVGLDRNSGGYPIKTEYPNEIQYWNTKDEALKYMIHWPDRIWEIKEIQFRIVG